MVGEIGKGEYKIEYIENKYIIWLGYVERLGKARCKIEHLYKNN